MGVQLNVMLETTVRLLVRGEHIAEHKDQARTALLHYHACHQGVEKALERGLFN